MNPGEANGITCFLVPVDTPGFRVDFMWWTFNMPTDHPEVTLRDVRVPESAIFGEEGRGLELAQTFVHENRIRQAASGVGAAQFCIDQSVAYARERVVFGKPLWMNQAIQFPLAELQTECEMVRTLVYKTAWQLDHEHHMDVTDKVSMCNYRANRLVCDAADQAIQVHGGIGYTRHKPFEHIYRHHRRYRITEGSEEIQIRRVAGIMFGRNGEEDKRCSSCALWKPDFSYCSTPLIDPRLGNRRPHYRNIALDESWHPSLAGQCGFDEGRQGRGFIGFSLVSIRA